MGSGEFLFRLKGIPNRFCPLKRGRLRATMVSKCFACISRSRARASVAARFTRVPQGFLIACGKDPACALRSASPCAPEPVAAPPRIGVGTCSSRRRQRIHRTAPSKAAAFMAICSRASAWCDILFRLLHGCVAGMLIEPRSIATVCSAIKLASRSASRGSSSVACISISRVAAGLVTERTRRWSTSTLVPG